MKGIPPHERVYNEIRMRAATRFPAISVASLVGERNRDIVAGSHAVSGAFTRAAWEQVVADAIREAGTRQLQSTDWVLQTATRDDLSLEGSPEQIQRELARLYKTEYAAEWMKFMQGITIPDFGSFDQAAAGMNRLGDPAVSPILVLLRTLHSETSWDNPSPFNRRLQDARRGTVEWFRTTILRQVPARPDLPAPTSGTGDQQPGLVGREFAGIAGLTGAGPDGKDAALLQGYLAQLSKVRARLNQIANSGDIGPPSRQLMQATLDGSGSELSDALKYVDETMLAGMQDAERTAIRPLLVRPLMQAFAAIVAPTEQELDRTWRAQVFEPFDKTLGAKYPFAPGSGVEATASEIAQVFGPDGSIAKFVQAAMGPLVVRRGDTLAARTWAGMGIRLSPQFASRLPQFVAHTGTEGAAAGAVQPQTSFQLQPLPTPGLAEYTIEIDGQTMRYRNGRQDWSSFAWPSALGQPGARITAVTADGNSIGIADFPGQFGLEKLINAAQRNRLGEGMFTMAWTGGGARVSVNFRLVSDARAASASAGTDAAGLRGMRLPPAVIAAES